MRKFGVLLAAASMAVMAATQSAGAAEFRFSAPYDMASLDPVGALTSETIFFVNNIYEGLTRFNADLKAEPALAESWEVLEPTLWRFHLRPDVKFHNGEALTADDVVFSFKRATAPTSFFGWAVHSVEEVRKVDDLTVDIVLRYPNVVLPNEISNLYIMSKSWAEQNGAEEPADYRNGRENFATANANGTGPFKLTKLDRGVEIRLEANAGWWDKPVHNLTEVVYRPIQSDATRVAALLSGEADLVEPVPLQDIQRVRSTPGLKVDQGPSVHAIYLGLDQKSDKLPGSDHPGENPFKDRRVRQAVYQAIDIEAIRDKIMLGASTPTATLISPGIAGHDPSFTRLPYDLDGAKALMAEAGYGDGFSINMDCPNDSQMMRAEQICQALVPMLARIGIKANLTVMPQTAYRDRMLALQSSIYIWSIGSSNVKDGTSVLNIALHTPDGSRFGTFNPGAYSNARIDEIAPLAQKELDPEARQKLFSEALKLSVEDIGVVPLHQQSVVWGMRENVTAVRTPDNHLRLWLVRVE